MTPETPLTVREARAVREFLIHRRAEDAATAAGIGLRTLRRYLARDHVKRAVSAETKKLLHEATVELGRGAGLAARALVDMCDPAVTTQPNPTRVMAARAVLDGAARLIDLEDLEARIAALENNPPPRNGEDLQ